jgi:hypothetical protein
LRYYQLFWRYLRNLFRVANSLNGKGWYWRATDFDGQTSYLKVAYVCFQKGIIQTGKSGTVTADLRPTEPLSRSDSERSWQKKKVVAVPQRKFSETDEQQQAPMMSIKAAGSPAGYGAVSSALGRLSGNGAMQRQSLQIFPLVG